MFKAFLATKGYKEDDAPDEHGNPVYKTVAGAPLTPGELDSYKDDGSIKKYAYSKFKLGVVEHMHDVVDKNIGGPQVNPPRMC